MHSHPAAAVDVRAGEQMWETYAAAHPQAVSASPEYTIERFGNSQRLANELLEHVLSGRKRATAELVADFVDRGSLGSADAAFAADEGEDDLSLASWQREHRRYWKRVSAAQGREWSENDEIVFERFAVVWPPQHADSPPPRPPRHDAT